MNKQRQQEVLELQLQERIAELEQETALLRWENETLRTAAARYRACFENSPLSIVFIAADGQIVEANQAFERLYGMPLDQLNQRNFSVFHDPQLVDNGSLFYMQRAFAGETVMEPPTFYDGAKTIPDGRFSWNQALYYPIRDEAGVVREIVKICLDLTALKQAEEAILQERERAAQERLAELAKASDALRQTLDVLATESDLNRFIGHVLKIVAEQFDAPLTEYWFHPESGNIAYIGLSCWQGQIFTPAEQPGHPGALGFDVPPQLVYNENLHQRQRHFIIEDITTDPLHINISAQIGVDIGAWFTARGVNKLLNIPLRLGEKTIGALAVWLPSDRHFNKQQIELGYALAQQVTLAIKLTQLAEQAKQAALAKLNEVIAQEQEKAAQERAAQLEKVNADLRLTLDQLAESEERFRTLFELSSEGFHYVEFDPPYPVTLPIEAQCELYCRNLRVVQVNPAFAAMYGVDNPDDLVGLKIADVHVADSEKNAAFVRAVVENGYRGCNIETEEIDTQGQLHYFLNSGVITIKDGYVVAGWGTQIDITELRQTQQALLRAEQERVAELAKVNDALRQRDRILEATAIATNALLTVDNFDAAVNTALQIIGESLDTDRVAVIENFDRPSSQSSVCWRILYEWDSPDAVSQISHPDLAQGNYEEIEEWYELFSRGQGISCLLEEMPEPFRSSMAELGVKALHIVPIFVEGKFWGVVGFDDCCEAKRRSPAELAVLKTAAACIGGAIQRDRIQRAREKAERQVLLEQEKAAQERVTELAKANDALKQTLDVLAENPELDKFIGHVLNAIANQFQSPLTEYWYHPDSDIAFVGMMSWQGCVCNREEISNLFPTHPGLVGFRVLPELVGGESLQRRKHYLVYEDHSTNPFTKHLDWVANWIVPQGLVKEINVPMTLGDRTIGALIIRLPRDRQIATQQIELAQALAHQATLAVQLTHLAEESRQATLLEERNRMAREIHDTLAQAFTGIFMQLQAASRFLASEPEQTQLCINRAQNLAREGLAEARRSVWYLHQEGTEDGNLLHTLTRITEQLTAGTSVQAKVYLQGTPYCLSSEVGMNLLRIAQESITNALRHAQAQMIHISLSYQSERVQLQVWDDGQGFNQQRQAGSGFGLKGMRQRAQCIGACLEINTQPQVGTKVTVTVPIAGKLNNHESRTTSGQGR